MPVHLDAIEGPAKGQKIEPKIGKSITVGRTARAMVKFADDSAMSGLHFALSLSNGTLRLQNLSQTNGTEVNGKHVESTILNPGDLIKAGQTVFSVVGPGPSPYQAQFRVGGWGFEFLPEGWEPVRGFGFRHQVKKPFQATMSVVEESLPTSQSLLEYVGVQVQLAKTHIAGATPKESVAAKIRGAEQALALTITTPLANGTKALQNQLYALHSGIVGVFTATALESQAQLLRPDMAVVLKGLSFFQA